MAGDYLLQAIAAVLLGMTMFEPGHANVPGTSPARSILALLNNGLVLVGAPYFMQDILLGRDHRGGGRALGQHAQARRLRGLTLRED